MRCPAIFFLGSTLLLLLLSSRPSSTECKYSPVELMTMLLRRRVSSMTSSFKINFAKTLVPVNIPEHLSLTKSQLEQFKPFTDWISTLDKSVQASRQNYDIKSIDIQSVDIFGSSGKIGFLKLKADIIHPNGKPLPGVVLLRGGTVGILVIVETEERDNDERYVVLVQQPRMAVGSTQLVELPAGMLDDGEFRGAAAKELEEECGFKIDCNDPDFKQLSTDDIFLSPGITDEHIRFFVYTKKLPRAQIDEINGKQMSGAENENEVITLKLVPLKDAVAASQDAKLLTALALYSR